ncbi:hypothetical protein [Sphaerisporangium rufum]|uniref:hypothetical protein n=1 Tax=Sphaerisporangium rufum TaxID=1381558 RepID=UPI001EF24630|nr:hypothetical protein [Sphaerisporangium rufum]
MVRIEGTTVSWERRALGHILTRVAETESRAAPRWPLYADPASGSWTTTARGSWAGGFWAGLLWLRVIVHGDEGASAAARSAALAPWLDADTAARGLIFWYGTSLARDRPESEALRERAAQACLDAFDPTLGMVPWGTAFGGPRELARVDALPGLVPLLGLAGPPGDAAAGAQLRLQLDLTDDAAVPAWARRPDGTWRPHPEPPSGWSRTIGWLALACADAAHTGQVLPPGELRQILARPCVAARFAPGSPAVPPASAVRRGGPPDTSAAAIEAVAALKLAALAEGRAASALRDRAAGVLAELVGSHLRDGRLLDGCYDLVHGVATRHELVWGDFFLAAGLAMLIGAIGPFAC